ncbi:MAG: sigma-70 family RNA polymerase sigma factor [Anaerolineae bacterium]|jgi:RNA polymerase sigma-70 factor (ECF subfamily)|nr:sigma-70 family RNA polymerase sigma factor [Anaerolineae bacterium]
MFMQDDVQGVEERRLLEQAQCGDQQALASIFDRYYERIYAYIYRRTGQASLAEDLAGEVFLRLVETLKLQRGPNLHLGAWLYRVAHNLVVDHFRRNAKAPTQSMEDWLVAVPDDPLEHVEQEQLQAVVRQALRRLTPDQQQVIILKFVEGLSNAEVGLILGKPEGAVKSLQHRALAALRRQLEKALPPSAWPRWVRSSPDEGPKGRDSG